MVIHTKEKTKLHIKQEPEAKIKGRNVLVVDKGPKIAGTNKEDKTVIKKSSAKEAVKNSMQKEKGMYAQVQRAKQDREKAIGKKNNTAKAVASAGAMTALDQMDGGNEVYESYQVARTLSAPAESAADAGRRLYRSQVAKAQAKKIKKVQSGKKIGKKAVKDSATKTAKYTAKKVAKEKYGLDVELVGFSGSLLPNDATNHGELDANVFQHRPFLEQDNQAHGYKLVAVGNTFVFPMAGYSKKIKTVAQIKEGATVAIPNDPTNLGRALLLLQKEKLITLKEGKGLLPTALDITDNPRHLQIMELEGAQLPRVLDDPKVDVAIISTTYIQQTGLSPVHDSVFIEDKNSPYVNILVAREDNKNAENVKEFLQSYQSPEVAKAAETIFNGGAVPGW